MTNQEVVDRIADAIRNTQMVVAPDDTVIIYAEDEQNIVPGKKYLFYFAFPLAHYKQLFESQAAGPVA